MKKIIIILIGSVLLGSLFAFYIYREYNSKIEIIPTLSSNETIYLLQIGAYEKEDNVIKVTKTLPNYYVENDGGLYHIYIGIVKNKENIDKIKEFYKVFGNNIYVREKNTSNIQLIEMLEAYEKILINTTKKEVAYTINKELLNKYKEVING